MAWQDKPSDAQIGALIREYEPYLFEELDHAKRVGATAKVVAIENMLDEDVLKNAVLKLAEQTDRSHFSKFIATAQKAKDIAPSVQQAIDDYFKNLNGICIDYERVRHEWGEETKRSVTG